MTMERRGCSLPMLRRGIGCGREIGGCGRVSSGSSGRRGEHDPPQASSACAGSSSPFKESSTDTAGCSEDADPHVGRSNVVVVMVLSITIVWVPGVSGPTSATQPCATERPAVPAGCPKRLSAGRTIFSSGVSTSVIRTGLPSTVTVGATCTSSPRVHTSAVRLQWSRDLRRYCTRPVDPATNTFVPGFTVQDRRRRAPVAQPSAEIPAGEAEPPEPKEFGRRVSRAPSSTAPRDGIHLFDRALAAGATAKSAITAISAIRVMRDTTTPPTRPSCRDRRPLPQC